MLLRATNCCALTEIADLSHHPDPKTAMKAFCLQYAQEARYDYNTNRYIYNQVGKLNEGTVSGLYLFTGVVKHTDGTKPYANGKYGPAFASFIRKNKLGKVAVSTGSPNRVNHPTHVVKAWVWVPDVKTLSSWYAENK